MSGHRRVGWLLALALGAAGCGRVPLTLPKNRTLLAEQDADFARLFRQHCSGCHGHDGHTGPAPPLNDPIFRSLVSEGDLTMIVAEGRKGTLMPAFADEAGGDLSDAQITILAKGILAWGPKAEDTDLPPYEADKPGDPKKGRALFAQTCADCHGADGTGGRNGAIHQPDLLALLSDQALRRLVITGRPDLGMPSYRDYDKASLGRALTAAEVSDLVAFVTSWKQRETLPGPKVARGAAR